MNQESGSEQETKETKAFDFPQQNVRLNTLSITDVEINTK